MKQVCDYCGGYISDLDENCPHCGAANAQYKRSGDGTPKTIEELKKWYTDHNLPPEDVTRFFIGKDYKNPKAFGIYEDQGRFIVYKNKADGSRAIRYDGGDEAYAVNELYLKLKEEIAEQKAANKRIRGGNKNRSRGNSLLNDLKSVSVYLVILAIYLICIHFFAQPRGYYNYNGQQYYHLDDWYLYDTVTNSWVETSVDDELVDNLDDYFESSDYSESYGTSDFEDTTYYSDWEAEQDSDSDWDSDSNWDSGDSWDSGGSDWDSDW